MKILVTGANGYLGQGIVKHLLEHDADVVATDIKLDHVDKRAECMAADLFTIDDPYDYFGQPDVLLHLAMLIGWDGFVSVSCPAPQPRRTLSFVLYGSLLDTQTASNIFKYFLCLCCTSTHGTQCVLHTVYRLFRITIC